MWSEEDDRNSPEKDFNGNVVKEEEIVIKEEEEEEEEEEVIIQQKKQKMKKKKEEEDEQLPSLWTKTIMLLQENNHLIVELYNYNRFLFSTFCIILTYLLWNQVLLVVVFLLGFFYCSTLYDDLRVQRVDSVYEDLVEKLLLLLFTKAVKVEQDNDFVSQSQSLNSSKNPVSLSPPLAPLVADKWNILLDFIIKDFIMFWYDSVNLSKSKEFLVRLRHSMYALLLNGKSYIDSIIQQQQQQQQSSSSPLTLIRENSMKRLKTMVLALCNVFIVHLKEFKQLEKSSLLSTEALSDRMVMMRLRDLSDLLVRRLMSKSDSSSLCMVAIVKEVLCSHILLPLLDYCSTPYFLNQTILLLLISSSSTISSSSSSSSNTKKTTATTTTTASLIQKPVDVKDCVKRPDTFVLFMEYMDMNQYPAYLRFLNNIDVFRQFARVAQSPAEVKQDALDIYESHFGEDAMFPVPLVTTATYPLGSDVDENLLQIENQRRIKNVWMEVEMGSVYCFDFAQTCVYEILEKEYYEKFIQSEVYKIGLLGKSVGASVGGMKVNDDDDYVDAVEEEEVTVTQQGSNESLDYTKIDNTLTSNDLKTPHQDSSRESSSESLNDDGTSKKIKHLAEAITTLREQLLLIDTTLSSANSGSSSNSGSTSGNIKQLQPNEMKRLSKLNAQKKQLERQIAQYMQQAEQINDDQIDFTKVSVKITQVEVDSSNKSVTQFVKNVAGKLNPLGSMMKNGIFLTIQFSTAASAVDGSDTTTLDFTPRKVRRSIAAFEVLDRKLKSQFEKCKKIKFPSTSSASLVPTLQISEEKLVKLQGELNTYLQILLGDQLLCESGPVQMFFSSKEDSLFIASQESNTTISATVGLTKLNTLSKNLMTSITSKSKSPLPSKSVDSSVNSQLNKVLSEEEAELEFDLDVYIDSFFKLITEMFDLNLRNQWIRRKSLSVLRQILLQQSKYTSTKVTSVLDTFIVSGMASMNQYWSAEGTVTGWLDFFTDKYWPMPERTFTRINWSEAEMKKETIRLRNEAKEALFSTFLNVDLNNSNQAGFEKINTYLSVLVGRYNTLMGVQRVFEMLQNQALNRVLILSLAEVFFKILLDKDQRVY